MTRVRGVARINVKALAILMAVVVLLGVGAVSARYVRKRIIADRGLAAGNAAFEQEDWAAACKQLKRYLERYPDERPEILEKYARARLNVRPSEPGHIGAAIGAYRRLLRLEPGRASTYEALAGLYIGTRNFGELAYIARKRLEHAPDDPKPPLWLATAFVAERKTDEARRELQALVEQLGQRDGKYAEYVDACVMLRGIAAQSDSLAERSEALDWLNKAVAYDPQSAAALVQRARFYRVNAASVAGERDEQLAAARQDLEAADNLQPTDPALRLVLCQEWTEHREFERASADLEAVEAGAEATLKDSFPVRDDWLSVKFLYEADLLLRRGEASEGAALADKRLAHLEHRQHRMRVLPLAVRLYLEENRIADAQRCLDEYREALAVSGTQAGSDEVIAVLGSRIARAEGKSYRVIELLEPYLDREPSDPVALKLLADAYLQTGQNRRAIRALEQYRAHWSRPEDPEAVLRLARERMRAGRWTEASRIAQTLAAENVDARLVRVEARLGAELGRGSAASAEGLRSLAGELRQLHESYPKRVDIRLLEAAVAGYLGKMQVAEEILQRAIDECADPLLAAMTLARFYLRMQRIDEALEVCRAACDHHSAVAAPWLTLSEILESTEQYAEARDALGAGLDAVESPSAKRDIGIRLALFDLLHDARQAGIERLKTLAADDPTDARARSLLLDLPETRADEETAKRLIDELREIQGDRGLLWRVHQASLWMSGDDWRSKRQEIQDLLEHCVAADPGWSAPVLLLGRLHSQLGEFDEAEQAYERALAVNPGAADVADRLLTVLQEQNRFTDARRVLDRLQASVRVPPERRVEILLGAGDVDTAIEELKLRVAGDAEDVNSLVALARLTYGQTRDATQALRYLDQAESVAGKSMAITAVRAAILRSQERLEEVRQLLDAEVERGQTFEAYFLRASFFASIGETELAEKDCIHLTTFENRPDGYALLGLFYADMQRLDEAIAVWESGLAAYPDNADLKRRLMMGLLAGAQPEERQRGVRMLAELEQQSPDDPELLWARSVLLLEQGTPETIGEAERLLERVTRLQPTAVDAHLRLIQIAVRRGELAGARELAIRALGSNPDAPRLLLARAEIEGTLGNLTVADTLVRLVLGKNPGDTDALNLLTQLALKSDAPGMLQEAQQLLEDAFKQGVDDTRLQIDLALVQAARGETDRAIATLESLRQTAQHRDAVATLLLLSDLYRKQGEFKPAGQRLDEAAALAPQNPDVLRSRITLLAQQGKLDEIVSLMEGDRPSPPCTPGVLFHAGLSLASAGSAAYQQAARDLFETALTRLPSQAALRVEIAGVMYQTGAVDRAEEIYRAVLDVDPENARALNDLAWILAEARHAYEEALPLADHGLEIAPRDTHLLDTRGVILSNLPGRLEDARRDFERCAELSEPGTAARAKALLQLGRTCAHLDDKSRTRRALQEALEIDGRHGLFTLQERAEINELLEQASAG